MAESVETWLDRVTRVVDENATHTAKIILTNSDRSMVLETWEGPFQGERAQPLSQMSQDIAAVIESYVEEWSKQRHQVCLIALDAEGGERSTKILSFTGRQAKTSAGIMGGIDGQFESTTRAAMAVWEATMKASHTQIAVLSRTVEQQQEEIMQLLRIQREEEQLKLIEHAGGSDVLDKLSDAAAENMGGILELVSAFARSQGKRKAAESAGKAAGSVTVTSPTIKD